MKARVSEAMTSVIEFHRAFGLPVRETPGDIPDDLKKLRGDLLHEEASELVEAMEGGDLTEIAKEMADVLAIVYGTAISYGIDVDEVFRQVHQSNMSKLDKDGRPVLRADGKVLKSELYRPPYIDLTSQLLLPLEAARCPAGCGCLLDGQDADRRECGCFGPCNGGEFYLDCPDCNYDRHACRGCGEPISHGALGCRDCMLGGHGG